MRGQISRIYRNCKRRLDPSPGWCWWCLWPWPGSPGRLRGRGQQRGVKGWVGGNYTIRDRLYRAPDRNIYLSDWRWHLFYLSFSLWYLNNTRRHSLNSHPILISFIYSKSPNLEKSEINWFEKQTQVSNQISQTRPPISYSETDTNNYHWYPLCLTLTLSPHTSPSPVHSVKQIMPPHANSFNNWVLIFSIFRCVNISAFSLKISCKNIPDYYCSRASTLVTL